MKRVPVSRKTQPISESSSPIQSDDEDEGTRSRMGTTGQQDEQEIPKRSITGSSSPPKSILRQNSPSKGTRVRMTPDPEKLFWDFFQKSLKIVNEYIQLDENDSEFKTINEHFRKRNFVTKLIIYEDGSEIKISFKDKEYLTKDRIQGLFLRIFPLLIPKTERYEVYAKINRLAFDEEFEAYLVPYAGQKTGTFDDFWLNISE